MTDSQLSNVLKSYSLSGKRALVTGAAGGIGRATCMSLAAMGCELVLVDRQQAALEDLSRQLVSDFKTKTQSVVVDLESEEERERLCGELERLDILINNAAFVGESSLSGWVTDFEEQSVETWRRAVEVNLTAVFHLSQKLTPLLKQSEGGAIVNIGSIYGIVGPDMSLYEGTSMGNPAAYAASKGGLVQLTNWLATTLAPQIRVNCVSPGGIFRNQPDAFLERYLARTPMGRMATEQDIAGAIVFLSSPVSGYVTGHNLVVDGGWTAW